MYVVYSLLTLGVFVVVSPYFVYQAIRYHKYIGSLRQRLFERGFPNSFCPRAINVAFVCLSRFPKHTHAPVMRSLAVGLFKWWVAIDAGGCRPNGKGYGEHQCHGQKDCPE